MFPLPGSTELRCERPLVGTVLFPVALQGAADSLFSSNNRFVMGGPASKLVQVNFVAVLAWPVCFPWQ